jgi:hypothetical protein
VLIDVHSLEIDYVQLEVLILSLDTKVTSDDPFLALFNLTAFVQHAVSPVSMEQRLAYLKFCHDRRRWSFTTTRRVRIEYSLATFAASGRPCKVE